VVTDSLTIKSSNSAEIKFSEREGLFRSVGSEYFRVTLKTENMMASLKVYIFDPFDKSFCHYFADIAENWRGWNGTKQWNSLESELQLSSESDSLGHITMDITLESYENWKTQIILVFDAGQLDDISSKIKAFFTK
jgi:hypothetical protein